MRSNGGLIARLDIVVLSIYILLVLLGWLNIYAANYSPEHPSIFDTQREYGMQFIWLIVGLVFGYVILLFKAEFFRTNALFVYLGVILMLILVLIFGKEVNGAKSWFGFGGFGLQPSEFAKVATALAVGAYLSDVNLKLEKVRPLLITLGLLAAPCILILLQPDAGTLLVFLGFSFVMYREGMIGNILFLGIGLLTVAILTMSFANTEIPLFVDGWYMSGELMITLLLVLFTGLGALVIRYFVLPRFRKKYFSNLIIIGLVSVASVWVISTVYHADWLLQPHHKTRLDVLFGHKEDPSGAGYNVEQSKTAIGSGGFAGKGFLKGVLTKYKYVPMQSTDFIFCTVGEEWGFIGSSLVIILFMALLMRLIHIAERQRSKFTRVFAYAVASVFFMHLLINIGMAIGLAPVIGIPLPFFSYGGSSFLGFTAMIFILLKLDAERLEGFR